MADAAASLIDRLGARVNAHAAGVQEWAVPTRDRCLQFRAGHHYFRGFMQAADDLKTILDDVLSLGGRARAFDNDTPLLGGIPELDSMAVVTLMTAIEDHFGIAIADDDIDGSVFATFGSLLAFVEQLQAR